METGEVETSEGHPGGAMGYLEVYPSLLLLLITILRLRDISKLS